MSVFKSQQARTARAEGKRTSVEVARRLGLKTAAEVDCLVEDIQPRQEWHHVGWKPRFGEPKRTYMFSADDVDSLLRKIAQDPGALDRARQCAVEKSEQRDLAKKLATTEKIVFYDNVVRVTPKAICFDIKGSQIWLGKFQIKSHDPRTKTVVVSAAVAQDKGIGGINGVESYETGQMNIKRINAREYQVTGTKVYTVKYGNSGWQCSCPAYRYRGRKCKHIDAIRRVEEGGIEGHEEKPRKQPLARFRIEKIDEKGHWRVLYTGTTRGSWFTFEEAKKLVNYDKGEAIYEYSDDFMYRLWEVL